VIDALDSSAPVDFESDIEELDCGRDSVILKCIAMVEAIAQTYMTNPDPEAREDALDAFRGRIDPIDDDEEDEEGAPSTADPSSSSPKRAQRPTLDTNSLLHRALECIIQDLECTA
jgi:hypothetical protein